MIAKKHVLLYDRDLSHVKNLKNGRKICAKYIFFIYLINVFADSIFIRSKKLSSMH